MARTATASSSPVPNGHKIVVIYRQGGTERCRWVQVTDLFNSRNAAKPLIEDLARRGYKAITKTLRELITSGLPVGWDSSRPESDWELRPDGFYWLKSYTNTEAAD